MILVIAALLGALGCGAGLVLDPRTLLASYLAAAVAVSSVPLGALGVLMIAYLVRARWTGDLYAPLAAAALTLPLAGLLFLPVLIGMATLYPWVSEPAHGNPFQSYFLVPWFFGLRAVAYFVVCSVLAAWVVRSYNNDLAMKRSASAGLIVYALVVSIAGIDWLESITPDFHSSIYGLLFLVFVILSGYAFGMLSVLAAKHHRAPLSAYAGILLSTLLLWTYNHAMQYIIIWAGNLPDEMAWYVERLRGGWGIALWGLYVFQFILPFFALLSRRVREHRNPLLVLAAATLALRFLEAIVLVIPAVPIQPWLLLLDLPAAIVLTSALWLMALAAPLPRLLRLAGAAPPK
jgi:hypothetical protein